MKIYFLLLIFYLRGSYSGNQESRICKEPLCAQDEAGIYSEGTVGERGRQPLPTASDEEASTSLVASLLRHVSCLGSAEAEPEIGILGHAD